MEGAPIRPECEIKSFTELRQEAYVLHIVFGKYYFVKWGDSVATHGGHSTYHGAGQWRYNRGAAHTERVVEQVFRRMEGEGTGVGDQSRWEQLTEADEEFIKVMEALEGRSKKRVVSGWSRCITCGVRDIDRLVHATGVQVLGQMPIRDGSKKRRA